MKLLKGIFLLIILVQFMACRGDSPLYKIEDLEGNWLRTWSTDPRSDSMVLQIEDNYATVIVSPDSSDFSIGDIKWLLINPVVDVGNFQFYDLGADDEFWKASIKMISLSKIRVTNLAYPDAPGGKQEWIKL